MEGVKGTPGVISLLLESQKMQGRAKTPQRCTKICHILLKTTANVLRQKVINKSDGWLLSSFSFLFILFIFSAKKPLTGLVLFIGKWLVNSAFLINSLRAQEHPCIPLAWKVISLASTFKTDALMCYTKEGLRPPPL